MRRKSSSVIDYSDHHCRKATTARNMRDTAHKAPTPGVALPGAPTIIAKSANNARVRSCITRSGTGSCIRLHSPREATRCVVVGVSVCVEGGVKDVVEYNENQEERNLREDELMLEE